MSVQESLDEISSLKSNSISSPTRLRPNPDKCLARVPSLSKIDGVDSSELDILNDWYKKSWLLVYENGFLMSDILIEDFTKYIELCLLSNVDLERLESYISVQKLLYNGMRIHYNGMNLDKISQDKLFQDYYYTLRENPTALNSLIVLSNLLWLMKKCMDDSFALTCLVDVMLQAYLAALESFIELDGVVIIKDTIDYLAVNKRLKDVTSYLMKCMNLLDKLDISYRILQTSKIGVTINGIATSGQHIKQKIDYECGSDQVKLKATNLIKKWKAIRDASLPLRHNTTHSNNNSVNNRDGHLQRRVKQTINATPPNRSLSSISNTSQEKEGSFVLDIINTMVEQREIEKRRKIEIRNSQMNSKFKLNKSSSRLSSMDGIKPSDDKLYTAHQDSSNDISSSMESKDESFKDSNSPDEKSSELASLVNFFKEYAANNNNIENRKDYAQEKVKKKSNNSSDDQSVTSGTLQSNTLSPGTINTLLLNTNNHPNLQRSSTKSPNGDDDLNSSHIPPWK